MVRVIVIIAIVLQFLCVIDDVLGLRKCVTFREFQNYEEHGNFSSMILKIPSVPIGVDLQFRVGITFSNGVTPPRSFFELGLAQSQADSIRAISEGKPLRFRLKYRRGSPDPIIYSLLLNNQALCFSPFSFVNLPQIDLQYIFSTVVPQLSADDGNVTSTEPNTPTPIVVTQPTLPPTVITQPTPSPTVATQPTSTQTVAIQPTPTPPTINQECGRSGNVTTINQLVVRGVRTSHGQFPWLVAVFLLQSQLEFQCAGTLVTNTHVITAAHCFENDEGMMPASIFHIAAGRYRLRNWRERGSVNRNINEYRIHPDFKIRTRNANGDLAIAVLRDRVDFTPLIQPICLWSGNSELDEVVGRVGYVVGWGENEYGSTYVEEPRMSRQPIVSQEDCLWSHPIFSTSRSRRTFCAGARDGSGPCNGDSGSGLVLQDSVTGQFHLRGVLSLSLRDPVSMSCDLTQYVVYVDVAKHLEWVQQQISS